MPMAKPLLAISIPRIPRLSPASHAETPIRETWAPKNHTNVPQREPKGNPKRVPKPCFRGPQEQMVFKPGKNHRIISLQIWF